MRTGQGPQARRAQTRRRGYAASAYADRLFSRLAGWLVGLGIALTLASAAAQVSGQDRPILLSAINSVLENEQTNAVSRWSNPATGSVGTVTVTRTFYQSNGTPCRAYRWTLEQPRGEVTIGEGVGCRSGARRWVEDLSASRVTTAPRAPEAAAPQLTRAEIRSAQRMLEALGYDPGPADGRIGPQTRSAVRRFQQDRGLPADGAVSPRLLSALAAEMTGRGTTTAARGASSGSAAAWNRSGVIPAAAPKSRPLEPSALFRQVGDSVWVLIAARSSRDLRRRRGGDVSLGSAVAVSFSHLLTNCHVIEGRPTVYALQGEDQVRARLVAADPPSDRCVLAVEGLALSPVPGIRRFDDIDVGERVFTIGTPKGLERTLGEGLVSGLRDRDGTRYVQTTAPISEGSSGGGLFDQYGNLIGITTAYIGGGQQLNFAIAAEEYWR